MIPAYLLQLSTPCDARVVDSDHFLFGPSAEPEHLSRSQALVLMMIARSKSPPSCQPGFSSFDLKHEAPIDKSPFQLALACELYILPG